MAAIVASNFAVAAPSKVAVRSLSAKKAIALPGARASVDRSVEKINPRLSRLDTLLALAAARRGASRRSIASRSLTSPPTSSLPPQ